MNTISKKIMGLQSILLLLVVITFIVMSPMVRAYSTGQSTANLELPATSKTYHVTLEDNFQERWVSFNKRIYLPFNDEVYYIYFISATDNTVEYYFTWDDNTIIMDLGETASFDIDNDGSSDITFKVKDIYMETTTVEFAAYNSERDGSGTATQDSSAVSVEDNSEDSVEVIPSEENVVEDTETVNVDSQETDNQNLDSATSSDENKVSFFKRIGLWFKNLFGHKSE